MRGPDDQRAARRLFARIMAIADPIRMRMWAEAELTTGQLRVLMLLRDEPGSTLGALAAHMRVTAPTASGLVDRLVRQDFIRRDDDPQDRRYVRHQLTERGRATIADLEREGRALLDGIFAQLDDGDFAAVVRGMELLADAADAAQAGERSGTAK